MKHETKPEIKPDTKSETGKRDRGKALQYTKTTNNKQNSTCTVNPETNKDTEGRFGKF